MEDMGLPIAIAAVCIPMLILMHTVAYFDGKQRNKPRVALG